MDYSLLIAGQPLRITPEKMDARQEQDYYEHAAASQALPEAAITMVNCIRRTARSLVAQNPVMDRSFSHEHRR